MYGGTEPNLRITVIAFQKLLTIWFSIKQLSGKNSSSNFLSLQPDETKLFKSNRS